MMQTKTWRLLAVATLSAPLVVGCGGGTDATSDSAGGMMAMTDSTGANNSMSSTDMTSAGAMDPSVASFASLVNQAEIETGTLARTKARSADVKDYANDMVEDHQKAMQGLQDLSSKNGWTMGDSMTATGGTAGGGTMGGTTGSSGTAGSGGSTMGGGMSGSTPQSGAMAGGSGSAGATSIASTLTQMQQSHQSVMQQLRGASGAAFDRAYMDSQVAAHQQALDVMRQHVNSIQSADLRSQLAEMQRNVEEHLKRAQEITQKMSGAGGN